MLLLLACALGPVDPAFESAGDARDVPWFDPSSPTWRSELGQAGLDVVPGTYSVVTAPGAAAALLRDYDLEIFAQGRNAPVLGVRATPEEAARLAGDRRVHHMRPDHLVRLRDFDVPRRLGTLAACADSASQLTPDGVTALGRPRRGGTGAGVTVAIIDSGADEDHPDLDITGFVDVTGTTGGDDDNGHGTHVAGTLAALDDDIGVVGVAPDAEVWAVKALDALGYADYIDLAVGIDEAISLGADVINMSVGGPMDDPGVRAQVGAAYAAGAIMVAAAGNEGAPASTSYPGAYDGEVITVSAWDLATSTYAPFSNYGDEVDVGAAGTSVCSTYPSGTWEQLDGTSMASPAVAGAVAVMLELTPGLDFETVAETLQYSTTAEPDSARHAEDLLVMKGF